MLGSTLEFPWGVSKLVAEALLSHIRIAMTATTHSLLYNHSEKCHSFIVESFIHSTVNSSGFPLLTLVAVEQAP